MEGQGEIRPPYCENFDEQLDVIIEEQVPIFSFTFGIPSDQWLAKLKKQNILLIGTATNLSEAKLLESKGIHAIVAQSIEAGGHRGTFLKKPEDSLVGGIALIPQLADQCKVPVIAAGGIMDARGIIAALTLGAAGVQMGTAFLSCPESGIHEKYNARI